MVFVITHLLTVANYPLIVDKSQFERQPESLGENTWCNFKDLSISRFGVCVNNNVYSVPIISTCASTATHHAQTLCFCSHRRTCLFKPLVLMLPDMPL